jgi:hypothetical protein
VEEKDEKEFLEGLEGSATMRAIWRVLHMAFQFDFGFSPRPTLRLSEVEYLLRKHRILGSKGISRQTLINWIETGVLEGKSTQVGWVVYEDSFREFVANQSGLTLPAPSEAVAA